jgi:hypothetical protein
MERTPFGFALKMLGANRKFAEYGGINTKRVIALSMAISGILAGLAGAHLSMGLLKRLTINLSPGLGFEGIVVALLARNDPRWVLVAGSVLRLPAHRRADHGALVRRDARSRADHPGDHHPARSPPSSFSRAQRFQRRGDGEMVIDSGGGIFFYPRKSAHAS